MNVEALIETLTSNKTLPMVQGALEKQCLAFGVWPEWLEAKHIAAESESVVGSPETILRCRLTFLLMDERVGRIRSSITYGEMAHVPIEQEIQRIVSDLCFSVCRDISRALNGSIPSEIAEGLAVAGRCANQRMRDLVTAVWKYKTRAEKDLALAFRFLPSYLEDVG